MKIYSIKCREPKLDTERCYCINNRLWNKEKIEILNDTQFVAPKYYCPRHVSTLDSRKLAIARYVYNHPLLKMRQEYIRYQKIKKRKRDETHRKKSATREPKYMFQAMLTENEYRYMWETLYKELRNPLDKTRRIATIEELKAKRGEQ